VDAEREGEICTSTGDRGVGANAGAEARWVNNTRLHRSLVKGAAVTGDMEDVDGADCRAGAVLKRVGPGLS
jgi:hypothetical protein